jgi:hypothetical protein
VPHVAFATRGLIGCLFLAVPHRGLSRSGSAQISQTLHEKQVGETISQNAKVISEKAAHAAQVRALWTTYERLMACGLMGSQTRCCHGGDAGHP